MAKIWVGDEEHKAGAERHRDLRILIRARVAPEKSYGISVTRVQAVESEVMRVRRFAVMGLDADKHSTQNGDDHDEDDERSIRYVYRGMEELWSCS